MKDALLSTKEIWSCYQCGDCADTCPTQADPSEFMAATRRYAIASYDKTHLARTMYLHPVIGTVIALALAVLFALFMYAGHGPRMPARCSSSTSSRHRSSTTRIGVMVVFAVGRASFHGAPDRAARGVTERLAAGAALPHAAAWRGCGVESLGQPIPRGADEAPPSSPPARSSTRPRCGASACRHHPD
jgi:heterodisulfide reductase subunit C/quinone-modifying oxidoreductase subunit QmoC